MSEHLPSNTADREIATTRIFDAPRDRVFRAWTDPAMLALWWGPRGFTNVFHEFDFRPGGHWRFTMRAPDGTEFENHSVFVDVDVPSRIVLDNLVSPRFRLTAVFEDLGTQTRLHFSSLFDSADICEGVKPYAIPGRNQTLDRLAAHLATLV